MLAHRLRCTAAQTSVQRLVSAGIDRAMYFIRTLFFRVVPPFHER